MTPTERITGKMMEEKTFAIYLSALALDRGYYYLWNDAPLCKDGRFEIKAKFNFTSNFAALKAWKSQGYISCSEGGG